MKRRLLLVSDLPACEQRPFRAFLTEERSIPLPADATGEEQDSYNLYDYKKWRTRWQKSIQPRIFHEMAFTS